MTGEVKGGVANLSETPREGFTPRGAASEDDSLVKRHGREDAQQRLLFSRHDVDGKVPGSNPTVRGGGGDRGGARVVRGFMNAAVEVGSRVDVDVKLANGA